MKSYYTHQGYALLISESHNNDDHWFGGEPYHIGAKCPICKIPLLLIADIDCLPFRAQQKEKLFHNSPQIFIEKIEKIKPEKILPGIVGYTFFSDEEK